MDNLHVLIPIDSQHLFEFSLLDMLQLIGLEPMINAFEDSMKRAVQKPTDVDRVDTELFEVSERALIYTPIYEFTFQNSKTGKKKIVRMDGVTAKILSSDE